MPYGEAPVESGGLGVCCAVLVDDEIAVTGCDGVVDGIFVDSTSSEFNELVRAGETEVGVLDLGFVTCSREQDCGSEELLAVGGLTTVETSAFSALSCLWFLAVDLSSEGVPSMSDMGFSASLGR